ncbi:MAG: (2Fe-2S) ferredoxin domain-containing protein [Pseudomonadota bacterium]
MAKLKIDDLDRIKKKMKGQIQIREGEHRVKLTIHMGTCGIAAGARPLMTRMLKELSDRNITDVRLTSSGCAGLCSQEPMATVEIKGEAPVKYISLDEDKMVEILEKHVIGGRIVEKHMLAMGSEKVHV